MELAQNKTKHHQLGHTRANEERVRNTIITMMSSEMHGPWIAFNCGYNSRSMIHIEFWGFFNNKRQRYKCNPL